MLKVTLSAFAVLLALSLIPNPAQAQSRVFVAAQGSDSNPCTFAAPCRTFQHAHDIAAGNSEIDVLDPAGYGSLTITKSISIQGHDFSGISVGSGATGITINAGINDTINLRGLIIEGAGVGSTGIALLKGRALNIQNCVVRKFVSSAIGIAPSTPGGGPNGEVNVVISNTVVSENGGHGIYVQPTAGNISMRTIFNRVEAYNNAGVGIGIYGNMQGGTGFNIGTAIDSVVGYNGTAGFYVFGDGNTGHEYWLNLYRSSAIGNFNNSLGAYAGMRADNGGTLRVGLSNAMDDFMLYAPPAQVLSYGDNYTIGSGPSGSISNLRQ
jgi:hypothetical protein